MEYTEFRKIADKVYDGEPVVVDRQTALDFIKQVAIEEIKDYDDTGYDPEETADTIKETLEDYECVKSHPEWEKVLIEGTPMAGNGFVCRDGAENE